jgi:hypothetical protein
VGKDNHWLKMRYNEKAQRSKVDPQRVQMVRGKEREKKAEKKGLHFLIAIPLDPVRYQGEDTDKRYKRQ